jgi:hypothetical protein
MGGASPCAGAGRRLAEGPRPVEYVGIGPRNNRGIVMFIEMPSNLAIFPKLKAATHSGLNGFVSIAACVCR